jgi:uncharacterized protein (DUF427 family)
MPTHTEDLKRAREKWKFRGAVRPPWAIEPSEEQESVWDYPRPPVLVADTRMVKVVCGDVVVAESRRAYRVLETAGPPGFYLPPADVRHELLIPVAGSSQCEWKGTAAYWAVRARGGDSTAVAWSYPHPYDEFAAIRDYFGFYPGKIDCYVDAERVGAQPGGFYAGWVTSDVVGPFKGEPGTGDW